MIRDYTVYKTATGIIEHITSTDAEIDEILINEDETIVEGNYSSSKYQFVDGEPTEIEIQ